MSELFQHIIDAANLGGIYAIFTLGVALIFGVMRLINFAHGVLITVGGYVLLLTPEWNLGARLAASTVVVVALACAIERVAFRPLRNASDETLLISSFAVNFLIVNLIVVAFTSTPRTASFGGWLDSSFQLGGTVIAWVNIMTILAAALLLVATAGWLRWTRTGLHIRAAAEDFTIARILGVRSNRVVLTVFAASGVLASAAAFLVVARTGTVGPDMGTDAVLVAFVATILGGLGSLVAAVSAAFVLAAIQTALLVLLPLQARSFTEALTFFLVFLVLVIRPEGLFSRSASRMRV